MTSAITQQESVQTRFAWVPGIVGGLVIGLVQTVVAVSLANLVFSGPLVDALPTGITMALLTTAVASVVMAFFSSSRGVVATTQSTPMVVVAVAVSAVAGPLAASPALLPTVIALIVLSTLLTGMLLLLIGTFHLSGLVRYLPYPVMGGFLAGSGLLIIGGAVGVMADTPLTFGTLMALLTGEQVLRWLPGMLYGAVLFLAMKRRPSVITFPVMLVIGLAIFYTVLWLSGNTTVTATASGFLLGDLGNTVGWPVIDPGQVALVDWGAVVGQAGNIGVILVLTPIVLLLNISSIELLGHEDLDLDNELRAVGAANLLSALGGGMIGFHSLSMTGLSHRVRAYARPVGVIVGLVHLLVWWIGLDILAYAPKMLLGALLTYIGLNFAYDWIIERRHSLSDVDYAVLLLIAGTIVLVGFLPGIIMGLVAMIITFLITYSRTAIFTRATDGTVVTSNVERPHSHTTSLEKLKRQVYVLELQGFIFFGTAKTILDRVRARLNYDTPLRFLVIDFRRVTGLDSSALYSFSKLHYLAMANEVHVVYSHLPDNIQEAFERNGILADKRVRTYPDLDRSMEYCEERLLNDYQVTIKHMPVRLSQQLEDRGMARAYTKRLQTYMESIHFNIGDYLIRQDDEENSLYFIEMGRVTIYIEGEDGTAKRLRTQNMGTIVGEVAFFLGERRTASVVAELDTLAYKLTESAFERMKAEDPELVIAFEALMIRVVAERLTATNRELIALVD